MIRLFQHTKDPQDDPERANKIMNQILDYTESIKDDEDDKVFQHTKNPQDDPEGEKKMMN